MPVILLENDGLKAHVKDVIRQILEANDEAAKELGTTIEPRFKITFSAVTVSPGGLSAVQRKSSAVTADQFTDSTEEPVTVTTESSRTGEQVGSSQNKLEATGKQEQTNSEKSVTSGQSSQSETTKGTSKAVEAGTMNANDTTTERSKSSDKGTASQGQVNNTRQETVTEYSI